MKSILEELFFFHIDPDKKSYKQIKSYESASGIITNNEEALLKQLNYNEKRLFLELTDAYTEISAISSIDRFVSGFKLGAALMTEVFMGDITRE